MESQKVVAQFSEAIAGYSEYFAEWLMSPKSCFRDEDKLIVNMMFIGLDLKDIAAKFEISKNEMVCRLKKVNLMLKDGLPLYRQWLGENILRESGLISPLTETEIFLTADFSQHDISFSLFRKLKSTYCNNFEEMLDQYSIEKCLKYSRFSHDNMDELFDLLHKNKCLHLLKSYQKEA